MFPPVPVLLSQDFAKAGAWMYVDPAGVGALLAHIPALFPPQATTALAHPAGSAPGMPQLGLWEAAARVQAQWGRSQGLYFRALSRAAQMQEAAGEYHKDLTKREVRSSARPCAVCECDLREYCAACVQYVTAVSEGAGSLP